MTEKLEPLPRCCPQHTDWQELAEHLCSSFPAVPREQVFRNLVDARAVTERFSVEAREALDVGELIVRYRLLVSTGEIPDVARTDPQTHHVGGGVDLDDEMQTDQSDTSVPV